MRSIDWVLTEDSNEDQIVIPKEIRELAAQEGINTENEQKAAVKITNLKTGSFLD